MESQLEDLADAVRALTSQLSSGDSGLALWSGIIVPIAVSLVSSSLVIVVLLVQSKARRREIEDEKATRRELAQATSRRKAAAAMLGAMTVTVHSRTVANASDGSGVLLMLTDAIRRATEEVYLELDDEDAGVMPWFTGRLALLNRLKDSAQLTSMAADTQKQIRDWERRLVTADKLRPFDQ